MAERNGLAAAAATDNSTAEGLPDEDFIFEGEDGSLVGAGSDYGDDDLSGDDVALGTETQEELGESEETGEPAGEVPAGQQARPATAAPAVAPQAAPAQQATSQAPASGQGETQRAPLFHEMVRDNFDAAVEHVVRQGNFALSPKDAEVIDPAAAPVLQRVAAQVYLKAVSTVSEMLHTALPSVVRNLQTVGTQEQQAEAAFLTSYGFKDEHKAQLTNIAHFVRQSNPGLQGKQYADEVARMGHAMFGTKPPAKSTVPQPGKPGQPRTVQRKAFAPAASAAGGGGAPVRRAPGQPAPKLDPLADLNNFLRSGVDLED